MTDNTRALLEQAATTLENAADYLPKPNSTEAMILSSEIRAELAKPVDRSLSIAQRETIFKSAEEAMSRDINLSWRNAIVDATISAVHQSKPAWRDAPSVRHTEEEVQELLDLMPNKNDESVIRRILGLKKNARAAIAKAEGGAA